MAIVAIQIKQNDTRPYLDYTLVKDSRNTPHDLTGATVVFSMTRKIGGTPIIDEASVTIVTATAGEVRYVWQSGETARIGVYQGEFEVTFADATILTFPEGSYIPIEIIPEIA